MDGAVMVVTVGNCYICCIGFCDCFVQYSCVHFVMDGFVKLLWTCHSILLLFLLLLVVVVMVIVIVIVTAKKKKEEEKGKRRR